MKKLMAVLLAVVFVAVLVPMTVGAKTLSTEEKGLITKLSETIKLPDGTWQLPKEMITQAENYLSRDDVSPLTADQIKAISDYFDAAKAAVAKETTGEASKWSAETRSAVLDAVNGAANVLGLHAAANANGSISILDAANTTLATNDKIVKVTGTSVSGIVLASVGALTLLAACAFVSKKVELF